MLGAIAMFFLGKRKRKQSYKAQEVDIISGELDNVEAALKIYRVMLDDVQIKLAEAQKAYVLLEKRFQVAIQRNVELEKENSYLAEELKKCSNNENN